MDLRNFFKQYLPHQERIRQHKAIQLLSDYLHDPNIWHLHRRSSAGGAAIGMFCAFIPFPIQTITTILLTLLFRVNLPVALVFSLFSNPLTILPVFFLAYKTGIMITGGELQQVEFIPDIDLLAHLLLEIWQPLLLGCFILGTIGAIMSYWMIRLIWRINAVKKWGNRRKKTEPCQ